MVSLFPYDMTDAGLTMDRTVDLKVESVSWRALGSFNAPSLPTAVVVAEN